MDLLLSELKATICNEKVNGQIKKENDEDVLLLRLIKQLIKLWNKNCIFHF